MNVSCGSCPAKYAVPDAKVRGKRVKITCKRCGAPILIDGTALAPGSGPLAATDAPSAKEAAAPAAPAPAVVSAPAEQPAVAPKADGAATAPGKPAASKPERSAPAAAKPLALGGTSAKAEPNEDGKAKPLAAVPRVSAPRPGAAASTPKTPAAAPAAAAPSPSAAMAVAEAPAAGPVVAAPAALGTRARAAKKTMMGVPAPFVAPPTGPAAVAEAPAQRQQVVVSARRGFEAEPEPEPAAPAAPAASAAASATARKRAHKQTIMGGLQAPTFDSVPPWAAAAEKHWTVALTDSDHRDMTTSELVALFTIGKVTTETLVWRDGMPQWARPFDVPEVAEALRARGHTPPPATAAGTAPTPGPAAAEDDDDEVTRMVASPLDAPPPPPPKAPMALPRPAAPAPAAGAAAPPPAHGWDLDEDEVTRAMDTDSLLGKKSTPPIRDADEDEITRAVESPLAASTDPDAARKQAYAPSALPWPEPPKGLDTQRQEPAVGALTPSRPTAAQSAPSQPRPVPPPEPELEDEEGDDEEDESSGWLRWLVAALVVVLLGAGSVFGVFYTEQPTPVYLKLRAVVPSKVQGFIDRVTVGLGKHPKKAPEAPQPVAPPPHDSAAPTNKAGPAFDQLAAGRIMAETAANAQSCQRPGGPTGLGHVLVTFDRSGHAVKVQVLDSFANSESGRCIEQLFLKATVPPFAEPPVTVQKSFTVQNGP